MIEKTELIGRALIQTEDKFVFVKKKAKDYFFLPGGRLEMGESILECILRELNEELGLKSVRNVGYCCAIEHEWSEDDIYQYEINHTFRFEITELENESGLASREYDLEVKWISLKDFDRYDIRPPILKKFLKGGQYQSSIWLSSIQ